MKKRVLVIDDNAKFLKVMEATLRGRGYEVACAMDGQRGVELAQQTPPDLILLDFIMPKMNGFQVCKLLKQEEDLKDIPIILISGKGEQIGKRFKEIFGEIFYLPKPFTQTRLIEKVEEVFQGSRGEEFDIEMEGGEEEGGDFLPFESLEEQLEPLEEAPEPLEEPEEAEEPLRADEAQEEDGDQRPSVVARRSLRDLMSELRDGQERLRAEVREMVDEQMERLRGEMLGGPEGQLKVDYRRYLPYLEGKVEGKLEARLGAFREEVDRAISAMAGLEPEMVLKAASDAGLVTLSGLEERLDALHAPHRAGLDRQAVEALVEERVMALDGGQGTLTDDVIPVTPVDLEEAIEAAKGELMRVIEEVRGEEPSHQGDWVTREELDQALLEAVLERPGEEGKALPALVTPQTLSQALKELKAEVLAHTSAEREGLRDMGREIQGEGQALFVTQDELDQALQQVREAQGGDQASFVTQGAMDQALMELREEVQGSSRDSFITQEDLELALLDLKKMASKDHLDKALAQLRKEMLDSLETAPRAEAQEEELRMEVDQLRKTVVALKERLDQIEKRFVLSWEI